jgi:hydrophobe/amphiphile efflux-3 (HAE3) family protein
MHRRGSGLRCPGLLTQLLDVWASFVTRRRGTVLAGLGLLVAVCAANLPFLATDTAPENLLISFGDYERRVQDFRRHFGDTDNFVALLVVAEDVLSEAPLGYVQEMSSFFASDANVVRVRSIANTPLPIDMGAEDEAGLDELGGGGLEDLDALEGDDGALPAADPRWERALEVLIAARPERFPLGLMTVAERVGGERPIEPLLAPGAEVTPRDVARAVELFEHAPLLRGRLVSEDRQVAAVVLVLDPALGIGDRRVEAIHEIDAWIAAHPPPAGVAVHPAGLPHLRATISDAMIRDQIILVPLSLLVCVVLLWFSFRWMPGTLLPIATVGLSVVMVLGIMSIVGEPLTILMNTLPTLLIVMGISEAVHVIGRYVEETRKTSDRALASRRTIHSLAIASFLTSTTTAVGFASLTVAQTEMLRRFGVVAALGVMLAYVVLMTFVPAAITYFRSPSGDHAVRLRESSTRGQLEQALLLGTAWLLRRPFLVLGAAVVVGLSSAWTYGQIHVDTALVDTFAADDPVVIATHLVDEHLDGIRPLEVLVEADDADRLRQPDVLAALEEVGRLAAGERGVLRATSANDFFFAAYGPIAGLPPGVREPFGSPAEIGALETLLSRVEPSPVRDYLTEDGRAARLEVRLGDVGARRSIEIIHRVEALMHERFDAIAGVRFSLLGEGYIGSHGVDAVVSDLFGSLSLSVIVIFAMIALLFRSWRMGLLAIPTNVLPQLGVVAWMVIRGIPLDASSAVVFSVVIGVTVDLTIHGFARYLEERELGINRRAAILRSARGTGRSIVVATVTLVLGFGVLLFSGFVPIQHFGELISVALLNSLVFTLTVQPPLLYLFAPEGKKAPKHA